LPPARVSSGSVSGPLPGRQTDLQLAAFDGGAFAAWTDTRTAEVWADVYAATFNPDGTLRTGPFAVASGPGKQSEPAVACGASTCLVTWTLGLRVFGQLYSFTGQPIGSPMAVSGTTADYSGLSTIAFDGTDYRVVWTRGGAFARRIFEDGGFGLRQQVLPAFCDRPRVVSGPAGVMIACIEGGQIVGYHVEQSDGGFTPTVQVGVNAYYQGITAAAGADGFLVGWVSTSPASRRVARVDSTGATLDPTGVLLGASIEPPLALAAVDGGYLAVFGRFSTLESQFVPSTGTVTAISANLATYAGHDVRECALATRGDEGVVAFATGRYGLPLKLTARGLSALALLPPSPPLTGVAGQMRPAVAGRDNTFLALWQEDRFDAGSTVRAVPVDARGQPVGPVVELVDTPNGGSHTPAASSSADGYFAAWKVAEGARTRIVGQQLDKKAVGVGPVLTLSSDVSAVFDPLAVAEGPIGTLVAWTDYESTDWSIVTSLVVDGGASAPQEVSAAARPLRWPALARAGSQFGLAGISEGRQAVEVRLLDADGRLSALPIVSIDAGSDQIVGVSIASDGEQYLMAWAAVRFNPWDIYVQRVGRDGQLRGETTVLFRTTVTSEETYQADFQTAVAFDGTEFVVSFGSMSPTTGGDLTSVRIDRDGGVRTTQTFAGGSVDESEVSLAAGPVGRTLSAYRTWDPGIGAPRVELRMLAEVPEGFACDQNDECVLGVCDATKRCCATAASCPTTADGGADGGTDGGSGGGAGGSGGGGAAGAGGGNGGSAGGGAPGLYRVGCGCGSPGGSLLAFALLALARLTAPSKCRATCRSDPRATRTGSPAR
jgi:hypothetical protein